MLKVWKEQIQKAKDLYEEAKVASASQIDRFYLSYCGGGNVMSNSATMNERMGNLSVQASSELELDSDRVSFIFPLNFSSIYISIMLKTLAYKILEQCNTYIIHFLS